MTEVQDDYCRTDYEIRLGETINDIKSKKNHSNYIEKYGLVDQICNLTSVATIRLFQLFGITKELQLLLRKIVVEKKKSILVRYSKEENCSFLKELKEEIITPKV
jgi:hypothetical protein